MTRRLRSSSLASPPTASRRSNTLFVFTTEESDHFVGSKPTPKNCDGVTQPCSYTDRQRGQRNLAGLLATQQGITTPFRSTRTCRRRSTSPAIRLETGRRPRLRPRSAKSHRSQPVSPAKRTAERRACRPCRDESAPYGHGRSSTDADAHVFAHPDYFFFAAAANCAFHLRVHPTADNFTFAWNHGSIDPEIVASFRDGRTRRSQQRR